MNAPGGWFRRNAAAVVALASVAVLYGLTRYPTLSASESKQLAARFKLARMPLPEVPDHPPYKSLRAVHPALQRISAWISAFAGTSATLTDLDGDGLPNDLVSIDPRTDLVTVMPVPGTGDRYPLFTLDPAPLPYDKTTTAPTGSIAGDFNEDGATDVLVYFWGRTPVVYLRAAAEPGKSALSSKSYVRRELVESSERWFSGVANLGDLDGDGHVDLMIGNYFPDGGRVLDPNATGASVMMEGMGGAKNGGAKHVFLWAGGTRGAQPTVRFREVTEVFPPEVTHGWTLAMGTADLDGDLLPEIYFSHDFGPDRLMYNRSTPGRLQFSELEGRRTFFKPKSCVLGDDSFKGMGCDFADLNGDGHLDIYVSNIATRYGLTESHFVWMSDGDFSQKMKEGIAPYTNASEELGLSRGGWGWETRLADFDNDGVLEALQGCGFIKGSINRWPELQALGTSNDQIIHDPRFWPSFKPGSDLAGSDANRFSVRSADGRYYNIAPELGFGTPMVTKGIALGDVDGDGRLDFVTANQWEPSFFWHNEAPKPGAFLGLHLLLPVEGAARTDVKTRPGHPGPDTPGRPAIGALVSVRLPDGRRLISQVDGGSGHAGRRSQDVHLGLGNIESGTKLAVELKWRDVEGRPQQTTLQLTPGWHTVQLANLGNVNVARMGEIR